MKTYGNSNFFQLEETVPGVYAAIVKPGMGALGNAAILDLGNQTLVFDTFYTPTAAAGLREAAEQLTGRKVSYVVNSHRHGDHVHGNQVFKDAAIVSTRKTREMMATMNQNFLDQMRAQPDYPKQMEKNLEQEKDPRRRKDMETQLGEMKVFFADLPSLQLRLPDLTFEDKLVFHGSKRSAELLTFGGGHTTSDAFLYLPEEKILLIADLVPVNSHPMVAQGNLLEWIAILQRVESLEIQKIVPGHGPVGTFADIVAMRQYLEELKELAETAVKEKRSAEEISKTQQPEKYASWRMASGFERNLKAIFEQFSKAQKSA